MFRRSVAFFLLLMIALGCTAAGSEEINSFVVVDEEEFLPPDPLRQAWAMMQKMTKEQKVYQLFFVSPEDLTGEGRTTAMPSENVLERYPVGGVMIFGQNIENEAQLKKLTGRMQSQAEKAGLYPLFIASEEEGGNLSRVANKLGYSFAASPQHIGEEASEKKAREAGAYIAGYLAPLGFNLCFAPPADSYLEKYDPAMQAYSTDPVLVSRLASAMAEGLREGGIVPCYTHFPGHGAIEGNSPSALSIRRTVEEMRPSEWVPFRNAIADNIEMILVSHGIVRAVGDDMPASTSVRVIGGLLRGELGYQGVVITDALRMTAVTMHYKKGKEAVAAIKAGADMLLLPADFEASVQAVFHAIDTGEISMSRIEESVQRILAVKIRMGMLRD